MIGVGIGLGIAIHGIANAISQTWESQQPQSRHVRINCTTYTESCSIIYILC